MHYVSTIDYVSKMAYLAEGAFSIGAIFEFVLDGLFK
jgi:hypothetical protein